MTSTTSTGANFDGAESPDPDPDPDPVPVTTTPITIRPTVPIPPSIRLAAATLTASTGDRATGSATSPISVGSASTGPADGPDEAHRRPRYPNGQLVGDETVAAVGKLSEALEVVEQARGFLYGFHRLTGKADLALGEAVEMLRNAGHTELAERIDREIVGRNVIEGRWTFQIVEDYDDNYYAAFKAAESAARGQLLGGKRHLFEAEMKEDRRTHGLEHHEARPGDGRVT